MTFEEYEAKRVRKREIAIRHLEAGVEFEDIDSVYIGEDVVIGEGTYIGPCVTLEGATVIGKNCKIYQNSRLSNAVVGDESKVTSSVLLDAAVGCGTEVGPFAYLRPGTKVGDHCKVGDFVEVKNSVIGDGTKAAHLTYIGDADVGKNVNFGCGVVFVNYDGTNKHRSTVGDGCFIGCNANLVSPVKVGDGAYVAAGTTITEDVPEDALCIGRSRQTVIEGWAEKRALYRKK